MGINQLGNTIKLKSIDTSSLVDRVEQKLIDIIKENKLKVGDILPREIDLAENLGVSRTVIREALLRLKTVGLIETKKHKGSVLKNPNLLDPIKKILHPAILDENTLKDIFEMRLALEVGMADLIISRITPEDLKELEIIANEIATGDVASKWQIEDEIRFHGKLYEICDNQVLSELQNMLLPMFQYVHDSGLLEKPVSSNEFISHKELVEVLKRKNVQEYRTAIRKHLDNHFSRIL